MYSGPGEEQLDCRLNGDSGDSDELEMGELERDSGWLWLVMPLLLDWWSWWCFSTGEIESMVVLPFEEWEENSSEEEEVLCWLEDGDAEEDDVSDEALSLHTNSEEYKLNNDYKLNDLILSRCFKLSFPLNISW